jgi:tripartite-type tricarboxylate transporter receptor subunit TctC
MTRAPTSLTSLPGCNELQHKAQRKSRAVWEDTMDRRQVLGAVGAFACAGVPLRNAIAQNEPVEQFYKRRQLTIISYSPGVSENYARLLARHMGKHMPGEPNFIVSGMPGAGGMKAADYLNTVAPRDGTVICSIGPGVPFEPMLGRSPVKFDPFALSWIGSISTSTAIAMSALEPGKVKLDFASLTWIGNMSSDTKVCMFRSGAGLTKLEDFRTKKASIGATGQGSGTIYGVILKYIFGDNVQVVTGYPSTNDIALAMERGEVDGMCTGWGVVEVTKPDWIKRNFVNVLTQFSGQRDKRIPSVPLIHEASLPAGMSEAITFLTLSDMVTRPFVGPAGIPADRTTALRRAFDAAMVDPDFLAFARKTSLDIDPTTGEELAKIVSGIFATSPQALEFARKLYN